jgi:hypothetical protein
MRTGLVTGGRLPSDWRDVEAGMRVVKLDSRVKVLVPFLALVSRPQGTRGLTFCPGRTGVLLGVALMAASSALSYGLLPVLGVAGALLSAWVLGTAGGCMVAASARPTAFVKPLCMGCRLLPVIREHEAIHLSGVAAEKAVWDSMKSRHSVESLSLRGDPSVCSFCPIPKRLSEH